VGAIDWETQFGGTGGEAAPLRGIFQNYSPEPLIDRQPRDENGRFAR
jgi:hypothetical protein